MTFTALLLLLTGCGGGEEVRCGDGVKAGTEQCDDGNTVDGDGCQSTCVPTPVGPACGNGIVEAQEQCDDGNLTGADACEQDCTLPRALIECPAASLPPPASGTCSVTAGDANRLVTGVILAADRVYKGGQVLFDGAGVIQCVGCDCSRAAGGATATQVVCPRGVVSPGLINSHDHITYQGAPYTGYTEERYEHRHDWRKGNDGHTYIPASSSSSAAIRWGELRQVLSGTTSVAGSGGQNGLLRNLDKASTSSGGGNQEGLGVGTTGLNYETFPLGDSSGGELRRGCGYPNIDGPGAIPADAAYLPHIAEGIETSARNEFLCTSGMDPSGQDLVGERTAVIHGIGLRASDIGFMALKKASLVWSPRSNVSLYGDTASVAVYKRMGVNIALGTDWLPTGSMNLLRELRCADYLNSTYYNATFSDAELWGMITHNAARATRTESKIGSLAQGKVADIAIFRLNAFEQSPHRAVITANPEDVVLTVRGGKALYGDEALVASLGDSGCDTLDVCGTSRRVCLQSETGESLGTLQGLNANAYKLFFCGQEPANEPTCTPRRASTVASAPASVNGSTLYTGAPEADDIDGDGLPDATDNCPNVFNPVRPVDNGTQSDTDGDGLGDMCDVCPINANTTTCTQLSPDDVDADGVPNASDNCPRDSNPGQEDLDNDGAGNACDVCPSANPGGSACPLDIYAVKTPVDGSRWPWVGETVILNDVLVTATNSTGFFVQVHPGDANYKGPGYSGLFVYQPGHTVAVGDRVDLGNAPVSTFSGQLQLNKPPSITVRSQGNALPAPVDVTPVEVATGGARAKELEGVLVRVQGVTVTRLDAAANEFVVDGALGVDDFFHAYPMPLDGDVFLSLSGVMQTRGGDFKLNPTREADLVLDPTPRLESFGPAETFARDGFSGPTFPEALTVTLRRAAAQDTFVPVTSSNPALVVEGGGVLIPAGASSGALVVSADLSTWSGSRTATLTATLNDVSLTASVTALEVGQVASLLSLTPASGSVAAGATVEVTVMLDVPAPMDTTVSLAVSGTLGTVPASVLIPANQRSATFLFTANADVTGIETLTATLDGVTLQATVEVTQSLVDTDHVVISELAVLGPSGASDEFVELYNPTSAEVDLSGWKLQYKSATGATYISTVFTFPEGAKIAARGYYLVTGKGYSGSVAGDASHDGMAYSGTAGHVRLGLPGITNDKVHALAVDTVGYGSTADSAEGGSAISEAQPASGSFERKALADATAESMETGAHAALGNGYDSDNNASDFVLRTTRDPRSTASPTEP